MEVQEAIEEYQLAILRLTPKTRVWYSQKLKVFNDWCRQEGLPLEKIKPTEIRRFIQHVSAFTNPYTKKPITSYTVKGYAQVVKAFLNWCSKEDGIDHLVSEKTPRRIEMPKLEEKIIEIFTPEQLQALFLAAEKEYNYILTCRDKAILSVLIDTGIRASELITLTLENVHLDLHDAHIKVYGKGRKEREVGLGEKARAHLKRYITRYREASKEERHVFLNRYKAPLTLSGLDQLLYRLGEWAHITGVRCSPHTLRHTYAVNFLLERGDVYLLSRLMGHSSIDVTEVYLKALKGIQARKHSKSVLDSIL